MPILNTMGYLTGIIIIVNKSKLYSQMNSSLSVTNSRLGRYKKRLDILSNSVLNRNSLFAYLIFNNCVFVCRLVLLLVILLNIYLLLFNYFFYRSILFSLIILSFQNVRAIVKL